MHSAFCSLLLVTLGHAAHASGVDCPAELNKIGKAALSAPFEKFDQDGNVGGRVLGDRGCYVEAAQLIEYYALDYDSKYRALKWHLAQMHASAGNAPKALEAAQLSLSPVQAEMHPDFDWNDYVLATMAFLRRDRASFDKYRAALKEVSPRNPLNAANEAIVDGLGHCFEKPYRVAYECHGDSEKGSAR
jgi:hypothetical protein